MARPLVQSLRQKHSNSTAPVFIYSEAIDRHAIRDRTCYQSGHRVKPKQRRNQVQKRRRVPELQILEQTATLKVSAPPMPVDPLPVVEPLKRELGLLTHLQFHYHQAAVASNRQQIDKRALLAPISRYLRVNISA